MTAANFVCGGFFYSTLKCVSIYPFRKEKKILEGGVKSEFECDECDLVL